DLEIVEGDHPARRGGDGEVAGQTVVVGEGRRERIGEAHDHVAGPGVPDGDEEVRRVTRADARAARRLVDGDLERRRGAAGGLERVFAQTVVHAAGEAGEREDGGQRYPGD